MRYVYHSIFILVIVLFPTLVSAQQKFEKESRLKRDEVPSSALTFVDSLSGDQKVKWYLDEGFDLSTVEAKFILNSRRHSVEFDTLGQLLDVEVEVPYNVLPQDARTNISNYLEQENQKHWIKKIQVQYSGPSKAVANAITTKNEADCTLKYELVVKCRKEGDVNLYEYLFDASGEFLSVAQIVFSNASNIEY